MKASSSKIHVEKEEQITLDELPRKNDGVIYPLHRKNSTEKLKESDHHVQSLDEGDIDDIHQLSTRKKYQIQLSEKKGDPLSFI